MNQTNLPRGNEVRSAIDSLRGYIYQIYQTALAWTDLNNEELLYIEVAEDYSIVAKDALKAVQVKGTAKNITINSEDIIASIESFFELTHNNPQTKVNLHHLTTSNIVKEKDAELRIGDIPTLVSWRNLATTGDITPLRQILLRSKLSEKVKGYINALNDADFREQFLKRIHFDCGSPDYEQTDLLLKMRLGNMIKACGGASSQISKCLADVAFTLLGLAAQKNLSQRCVAKFQLDEKIESATQITLSRLQFESQNNLLQQFISAQSPPSNISLLNRTMAPSSIEDVPFPKSIAYREGFNSKVKQSLLSYGFCWISGSTGMGKTTGALIACKELKGTWVRLNLRGLFTEQIVAVLKNLMESHRQDIDSGILIDDLNCIQEQYFLDILLLLRTLSTKNDIPLIITSTNQPLQYFLTSANLLFWSTPTGHFLLRYFIFNR